MQLLPFRFTGHYDWITPETIKHVPADTRRYIWEGVRVECPVCGKEVRSRHAQPAIAYHRIHWFYICRGSRRYYWTNS